MLSALTLCLLLPLAEPEKSVETQAAPAVKVENSATVEKTEKTTAEKSAKDEKPATEEKSETKDADKASTEKTAEKKDEAKKDSDDELLQIEANIVSYTNAERARYGLRPLEVDRQLMRTAREHGSWMAWNRVFQHTRRSVAENIAMGQPSSQDVVRSWMNSSGHRANILNPNHGHIGVAAYRTASGTIYWVQQFSR
jgi:uncharacterized protein YkwD